jgi:hypothetical protein
MKIKKRVIVLTTIVILLILLGIFYLITKSITHYTGYTILENQDIESEKALSCLTNSEITLFISNNQELEQISYLQINEYLEHIMIIDCSNQKEICSKENIKVYPTWKINKNKIEKNISEQELLEYSGC